MKTTPNGSYNIVWIYGINECKNTLIKVPSLSIFDSCCQVIKISELSNMSPDWTQFGLKLMAPALTFDQMLKYFPKSWGTELFT